MVATAVRNADLGDLADLLKEQHAAKVDVVAPATALRAEGGLIRVRNAEAQITDDGVTTVDGLYRPTAVFDEGVADKLKIPVAYVRRLRAERPDLYDANLNGWLHGNPSEGHPFDPRSFLFRGFRAGTDDGEGVARALLSDKYARMDNFDVLMAALDGVRDAGVQVVIDGCDLSDRRMYVRIVSPDVVALAPTLLRDYRSPFRDPEVDAQRGHGMTLERGRAMARAEGLGYGDDSEPVVFGGFVITNSEVGGGAFTITPRLVVRVCRNGLTVNVDAMRSVHLGARLEEGIVSWSEDTQRKALALVKAKTRDGVSAFLRPEYVAGKVAEIEEKSATRLKEPVDTVKAVGKALSYDEQTIAGVLDHFLRSGDATAGGLMGAVTSFAQVLPDADKAADLEGTAMRALELAARA